MRVPFFWDEGLEILLGLHIAQGRTLPLTGVSPYQGPFFFYLIAGLIRAFGPHIEIGRVVALVGGSLLVVATYWVGRAVWSRLAGLIAAGLVLVSPQMIVETSHYGWANSLTPLFVALALLAVYRGTVARADWTLVAGGLLASVAVQTNPACATAALALAVWFLWRRDIGVRLRRRGPWLAVGALALIYLPVIVATHRLWSAFHLLFAKRAYALAPAASLPDYVARVATIGSTVARGLWGEWLPPGLAVDVMQALVVGAMAIGLVLALRREARVLAFVMVSGLVLQPLVVREAFPRYVAYLMPIAAVAIAISVDALARWLGRRQPRRLALAAGIIPLVIMGTAARSVVSHYQDAIANGDSNDGLLRVADQIVRSGACGPGLVIDLNHVDDFGNPVQTRPWFSLLAMEYVLTMKGCDYVALEPDQTLPRLEMPGQVQWLFTWRDRPALPAAVALTEVASMVPPPIDAHQLRIVLYRVR